MTTIKSVEIFVAGSSEGVRQIEFSYCLHSDPVPVAVSPKPMLTAGKAIVRRRAALEVRVVCPRRDSG